MEKVIYNVKKDYTVHNSYTDRTSYRENMIEIKEYKVQYDRKTIQQEY